MPMMARMRSLAPWFMFLVGGLFVLFMVLSDSRVNEFFGKSKQNVGSVDGQDITYQEYSTMVENAKKNQEQSTGQTIDESQMDFFRDQVWDAMVSQKLIDKKVKQYGIIVTDDEVRNAILGPNPPAWLTKSFIDSTGKLNRQLYENAIRDPRNKQILITAEENIRTQLTQEKLQSYLTASIVVSEEEAKNQFIKQNIKMKANYVMIDPNTISDTDVKVTDEDIKKYYDEHPEDYKVQAQRKLKYVLFKRDASQGDSLSIKKNLEAIVAKLKSDTTSFKSYVQIYSERPYAKDTIAITNLPAEAKDLLMKASTGGLVGPVVTNEGYVVYRLVDKVKSKNEKVRASHILVKSTGNDAADLKKANDIYNEVAKGGNFAEVAKIKSDDGSKVQGGDLGWFGKGQMVKPFEDACYNGKIGVVQKPVKSQFGYHIIKVTDKSSTDFVLEKIVNKIQISASTNDKLSQDAQDFAYIAKKDGYEAEAKAQKFSVIETSAFIEETKALPGIGVSSGLVKFAFENSVGSISDVFRTQAGFVVAMVSDVIKPGLRNFDEVKPMIKNTVLREKKLEKAFSIVKDIRSKVGDTGDPSVAKTIWASAKVDTTKEFTTAGGVEGIGRDFAISNYAIKGELNKWSQPVKGTAGAYLIKVTYRTPFDQSTYKTESGTIKQQLLQTKKNQFFGLWIQNLKKEADIVDNRYLFYR